MEQWANHFPFLQSSSHQQPFCIALQSPQLKCSAMQARQVSPLHICDDRYKKTKSNVMALWLSGIKLLVPKIAKSPKTHCAFRFKSQESQAFAQDVQTRFKTSWTQLSKQNQGPTTLMPPLELQAKVTPLGELAV
ncbi:hypothetical protein V6N11_056520 [Hibiscus sabdariffa]|uniref:Uncharacterized protein n=1 Tax=Hibiscus sabdariffa TaxID=183260 RepID=A0ABR2T428_9ROSI